MGNNIQPSSYTFELPKSSFKVSMLTRTGLVPTKDRQVPRPRHNRTLTLRSRKARHPTLFSHVLFHFNVAVLFSLDFPFLSFLIPCSLTECASVSLPQSSASLERCSSGPRPWPSSSSSRYAAPSLNASSVRSHPKPAGPNRIGPSHRIAYRIASRHVVGWWARTTESNRNHVFQGHGACRRAAGRRVRRLRRFAHRLAKGRPRLSHRPWAQLAHPPAHLCPLQHEEHALCLDGKVETCRAMTPQCPRGTR
ncbi:hypothetical protein IF1G_10118 [Cordyceps javanica]|uniref:Uncharacterized protein n=1 Tax=Cordyceps javanica TaxID=43265 RepID=A0A545UP42_9HYPO|nr:hypothetical protein IF1G_10118 [Cordyceps javanica]